MPDDDWICGHTQEQRQGHVQRHSQLQLCAGYRGAWSCMILHDRTFSTFFNWFVQIIEFVLEAMSKLDSNQFRPWNLDVLRRFLLIQLFHLAGNQLSVLLGGQLTLSSSAASHQTAMILSQQHLSKACFSKKHCIKEIHIHIYIYIHIKYIYI